MLLYSRAALVHALSLIYGLAIVKLCTGQASVFVKIRYSIFTDISGIPVSRTIDMECDNMLYYKGIPDCVHTVPSIRDCVHEAEI